MTRKRKLIADLRAFMRARTWNATYMGRKLRELDARIVNFTRFYHHNDAPIMKGYESRWAAGEKVYLKAVREAFEKLKKAC